VVVSQIATIDRTRLLEKIGALNKDLTEKVIEGCQMVISKRIF
jgi:hypothetical protein